jgi:predicted  nucleic acid-binding Zn-ribbon protein
MSKEMTGPEVAKAFDAISTAQSAADDAQERANNLYGHVEWLTEQLAERERRIEELEDELGAAHAEIEAAAMEATAL